MKIICDYKIEKYITILFMIAFIGMILIIEMIGNKYNQQHDYIQQLEQSLQEQIQEKEVYMKMLEEREWENLSLDAMI